MNIETAGINGTWIESAAEDRPKGPYVSVIVPSYNSSRHIRGCLKALSDQSTEIGFEIIVVDSSDDGTDGIVSSEFPHVRLVHLDAQCFTGRARNIGVTHAGGEIVLFVDSDCIPPPDWVEKMTLALEAEPDSGVCGSLRNGTPLSISGSVGYYLEFFRFMPSSGRPRDTVFLVGGNSGFRRDVLERLKFEDSNIGDDVLFSFKLRASGGGLRFHPRIAVTHRNRTGLRRVLAYQRKLGVGAYRHRRLTSPGITHILGRLPALTFLLPPAILVWIGSVVLWRRGPLEFVKFLGLAPLCLVANMYWARGFASALTANDEPRYHAVDAGASDRLEHRVHDVSEA